MQQESVNIYKNQKRKTNGLFMSNYVKVYKHLFIQNSSGGLDLTCSDHEHNVTASHTQVDPVMPSASRISGLLHESKDNGKVGQSVILVQVIEGAKTVWVWTKRCCQATGIIIVKSLHKLYQL